MPNTNFYWSQVFNNYKNEIQQKLGVSITEDDVEAIILHPYKISNNSSDYHLDCKVEIKVKQVVTATFWIQSPGATGFDKQYSVSTLEVKDGTAQVVAPEAPEAEKTVDGTKYKFMGWYSDQACTQLVTFPVTTSENVFYYGKYVPCDQSIQVNYYLDGTTTPVHPSKTLTGYMKGQTVTQTPIDVSGYRPVSTEAKTGTVGTDASIDFYYTANTVNYKVEYYWNGSNEPLEIVNASGKYGDTISDITPKSFNGYTAVSNYAKSLTLSVDEDQNVIKFYYYKNVTLTANSDTKTYNGQEQSVDGYATNLPEGTSTSFDDVTLNGGKGTNTGDYPYTFADGAVGKKSADNNYIVTEANPGNLHISPVTNEVTIKIAGHKGGEKYNGKEQTVSGYDVSDIPDGVTKDNIKFTGTAEVKGTNVYTYPMGLNESQFALTGDAAKNYTNVKFEVVDGELTIAKRQIWRITPDGQKNYDGAPLVRKGDLNEKSKYLDPEHANEDDGFVDGEGFAGKETFTWKEDAILPGEYDNIVSNVSYKDGTKSENYDVHIANGKLKINNPSEAEKHEIKITANSADAKYDGEDHSATGFSTSGLTFSTKNGPITYRLEGVTTSNPTKKDAGDYENTIDLSKAKVLDEKGNDVTELIKLTPTNGKLIIAKRNVMLVSESKSFTYDGQNHDWQKVNVDPNSDGFANGESVTYKDFASIKNVGNKDNSFDFDWSNAKEQNYNIKKRYGSLNVSTGDISKYVTLKTTDVEETYNGKNHVAGEATATDANGNNLVVEYQKGDGSWTADRNEVCAVNVGDYGIVNVRVSSPANYGEGNYVTGTEKLVVKPVDIELTAKSDNKPYNGTALTNNGYDITNGAFVDDEGLDSVTVSGSQLEVGSSSNVIDAYVLKNNTKAENYNITTKPGTLEVTASQAAVVVAIEGNKDSQKYNGSEQRVSGYKVTGVTIDGQESKLYPAAETDFTFSGTATAARTDVGTTYMGLKADQFANVNENFTNVEFVVEDGWLKIEGGQIDQNSVVWTLDNLQKKYDGNTYAAGTATAKDEFGNSLTVEYSADGEKWTTDPNTITAKNYSESKFVQLRATGSNYAKGEYAYSYEPEQLIIGKRLLTMTSASDGKEYDGTPLTKNAQSDVAVTEDGFVDGEGATYGITGSQTEVGSSENTFTYELKEGTLAENYQIKLVPGTLTVTANGDQVVVTIQGKHDAREYNGQPQSVEGYEVVSISNDKYTSSDFELTTAGKAKAERTDVGTTYMGLTPNDFKNKSDNFTNVKFQVTDGYITITPKDIKADESMTVEAPKDVMYNGKPQQEKLVVKDGEKTLTEGIDYTLSCSSDTTNVGTVAVTVTGKGNYSGSVDVTYQITPAPLTVNANSDSKVYDGEALTAGGTIKGLVGEETATAETEGSQTEVGSSANKVAGVEWGTANKGNYYIQSQNDGTLTVTAKSIVPDPDDEKNKMSVGTLADVPYNGTEQVQKPEVKDGEKTLVEGTDYKLTFSEDKTNVGTVTATVNGKGNYTGEVTRTYQITPATLTVTTPSDSKTYDGGALTAEGSISGFVNGETAAFTTTGSQTEVGSSINTYVIDWTAAGNTAKQGNYTTSESLGTLTVTETTDEIVATPGNYNGTYDGHAHGVDVTVTGLPKGYSVKTAVSYATATDVTDGVTANVDDLVIVNAQGEDVTNKLIITKDTGTIKISPATLKVTTYGAKAAYTGTALTAGGKVIGFVNNEAATFTTTGSQTEVGFSTNTYAINWNDTAKESNYTIEEEFGTLEVTQNQTSIMVIPQPGSKPYDGTALTSAGVTTYGLPAGYTLTATTKGSVTNVGGATAEVDTYTIKNASGEDVTDQFGNVFTGKATLQVTKRPVTVTSATASKFYDGTALTKHEANVTEGSLATGENFSYEFSGEQTTVGSTSNAYIIKAGANTDLNNYEITKVDGTLSVKAQSINPADPTPGAYTGVEVDSPNDVTYNGNDQTWAPAVTDGEKTLREGVDYTVGYSTVDRTNVTGAITVTITGMGNYTGTVTRTYQITPKGYMVVTGSASKVYDGTPLLGTDSKIDPLNEIRGLVNANDATLTVMGTQTEVGSSKNTYEPKFASEQMAANYKLESEQLGKLTVTENADEIVVTTTGGTFTYDGQAHGATSKLTSPLPAGYKLDKIECTTTVTNVADSKDNNVGPTTLIIKNAEGKDVTRDLNIKYVNGSITITPASLTVTTGSASKYYDGTPLTNDELKVDGLIEGDSVAGETTGAQTDIGQSDNTYKLTWPNDIMAKNYEVAVENLGKLTVYAYVPPTPAPEPEPGPGPTPPTPEPPTPGPEPSPTPTPTPEPTPEPTPATPDTPTTPDAPVAPTTPTTPANTATSSNPVADTVATTLENVYEAVTGDEVQPEEKIYDSENPLGTEQAPHCWVHWYMLVFMVLTAIYGAGVCVRRRNFTRRLEDDMNAVLNGDEKATPSNEAGKEE